MTDRASTCFVGMTRRSSEPARWWEVEDPGDFPVGWSVPGSMWLPGRHDRRWIDDRWRLRPHP